MKFNFWRFTGCQHVTLGMFFSTADELYEIFLIFKIVLSEKNFQRLVLPRYSLLKTFMTACASNRIYEKHRLKQA